MAIEERFINLISSANLQTIKYWVDNDMSLLQNLNEVDKLLILMIRPILNEISIDTDKVMYFLKANRPDIYNIVTRKWIEKQVNELNGKV